MSQPFPCWCGSSRCLRQIVIKANPRLEPRKSNAVSLINFITTSTLRSSWMNATHRLRPPTNKFCSFEITLLEAILEDLPFVLHQKRIPLTALNESWLDVSVRLLRRSKRGTPDGIKASPNDTRSSLMILMIEQASFAVSST
jgi:hypothetical protein